MGTTLELVGGGSLAGTSWHYSLARGARPGAVVLQKIVTRRDADGLVAHETRNREFAVTGIPFPARATLRDGDLSLEWRDADGAWQGIKIDAATADGIICYTCRLDPGRCRCTPADFDHFETGCPTCGYKRGH